MASVRPTHLLHLAWTATSGRFWTDTANLQRSAATSPCSRRYSAMTALARSWPARGPNTRGRDHRRCARATRPRRTPSTIAKDATRRMVCAAGETAGVPVALGGSFACTGPPPPPPPAVCSPMLHGLSSAARSWSPPRDDWPRLSARRRWRQGFLVRARVRLARHVQFQLWSSSPGAGARRGIGRSVLPSRTTRALRSTSCATSSSFGRRRPERKV